MGQKITVTIKKFWRKKSPTRGLEPTEPLLTRWFKAAAVRAIKTVAQTALASLSTFAVFSDVNWKVVISASLFAGFLSILTSLGGLPEVETEEYDADNQEN